MSSVTTTVADIYALTVRQVTTIAGWRRRDEPLGIATARAEAIRLAKRVLELNAELADNRTKIARIVTVEAPELLELRGIGVITAAVILTVWSHPGRIRSEAALAQILEAYDLTAGLRAAAALAGCDHKTVAHYVALRDAGKCPDERPRRPMAIDPFLGKVEEWVGRSGGRVRADVVHEKLVAMGFGGSERTTRRAVAAAKKTWRAGNRRLFRPWIPEPGLWLQFDWGHGPRIGERETLLFCAWLAWYGVGW